MSRTPEEISDMYRSAETVAESDGHEVLKDGGDDYWIGRKTESSGLDEEYTLVSSKRVDAFTTMLRDACVLEDAESSEEAESADVTPVSEVADLSPGQRVTVTDADGQSFTGTLQQVRFNHSIGDNVYTVHFQDRVEKYAVSVEPAETADESRAPEDVAETWVKATTYFGDVRYGPPEALHTETDRPLPFVLDPAYDSEGVERTPTSGFGANGVSDVDSTDLPFSEVVGDD